MEFEAIKKVNVSDEVYDRIMQSILEKKYVPGDKLPSEGKLAQMFGVSRVSVRAAIQRLAGSGYVESINGEGTFIKAVQENMMLGQLESMSVLGDYDMQQILDFRRGIEVVAAELAAKNSTDEEKEQLKHIYQEMEVAFHDNDVDAYAMKDLELHMYIAELSKNTFIHFAMEQMRQVLKFHLLRLNREFGPTDALLYHKRIVDAIVAGNQAEAKERMEINLMNSRMRTLEL